MEIDRLTYFHEILHGGEPLGIGEEIVVKHLNPFTIRVELGRKHRVYAALFVMDETERTLPNTTA